MTMQNPQTCLSPELLRKLSQDELSPGELKDVEDHISDCERCRQLLEVAQSDPQWQHEIVPILRAPLESPRVADDYDDRDSEGASLESILRLLGPTDDPHMLGRIGSYEVVGVIGRGGMGAVFKAFEPALNRFVAIKMLLPHLAASGAARKRFAREGQAAAAVIDDNVLPIYSVAEWQGVPYLVTQYSRGTTLQKRIQDQGPLELKEILRIGMQTARGLAAAHAQGLVHRDVKPSNILLDDTVERALLTDFGLARAVDDASITRTGIIAGTPQYMSPEQARGGSVDARSDLFGLGCVLYAMCTGRPPFRAENSYAILRMITDDEPRTIREINTDIPEWLCLLISRLMAKSSDARFGNALEVAALLEQCLAHVQQPTSISLPASLVSRAAGRRSIFNVTRKGALAMLGTIGMILLAMVLSQVNSGTRPMQATVPDPLGDPRQVVKTISGAGLVSRMASSADGRRIAMVSNNGIEMELRVVDVDSGKPVFVVSFDKLGLLTPASVVGDDGTEAMMQDGVTALEFSPDGKRLALGTLLGEAQVLDAQTGKLWRSLNDVSFNMNDAAFEKTPLSLKNRTRAMGGVRALAFSPAADLLAVGGESFQDTAQMWSEKDLPPRRIQPGRLKVWNFNANTVTHCLGHSVVTDVAFSADGRFLASTGRWDDGREEGSGVILWKPDDSEPFHKLSHDSNDYCVGARFVPNRKQIISVAYRDYQRNDAFNSVVRLTDADSGKVEWERAIPLTGYLVSGFTLDNAIGLQGTDWTFRLLSAATGDEILAIRPPSAPDRALPLDSNWIILPQRNWLALTPPCKDPDEGRIEIWSLDGVAQAAARPTPQVDAPHVDRRVQSHATDPEPHGTPQDNLQRLVRGGKIDTKSLNALVSAVARHASQDVEFARLVLDEFKKSCAGGDKTMRSRRDLLNVLIELFGAWDMHQRQPQPEPFSPNDVPATRVSKKEGIKTELLASVIEHAYSANNSEVATFTLVVRQLHHRDARKFLLDVLRNPMTAVGKHAPPADPLASPLAPFSRTAPNNRTSPTPVEPIKMVANPPVRVWKEPTGASWSEAQFVAAVGLAEMGEVEGVDWLLTQARPNEHGIDESLWRYSHLSDQHGSLRASSRSSLSDLFRLEAQNNTTQLDDWWKNHSSKFSGGRVRLKLGMQRPAATSPSVGQIRTPAPKVWCGSADRRTVGLD